jgi:hypothetical protein
MKGLERKPEHYTYETERNMLLMLTLDETDYILKLLRQEVRIHESYQGGTIGNLIAQKHIPLLNSLINQIQTQHPLTSR